jgi:hypothetical protein
MSDFYAMVLVVPDPLGISVTSSIENERYSTLEDLETLNFFFFHTITELPIVINFQVIHGRLTN